MKKSTLGVALLGAMLMGAIVMTGCKSTGTAKKGPKIEGSWFLYEAVQDGKVFQISDSTASTITFGGDKGNVQVVGFSGANNFSGTANINGDSISFSPFATTMMAGSPEGERIEKLFLGFLADADKLELAGDTMKISTPSGNTVSLQRFVLANTEWKLLALNIGNAVESISLDDVPSISFDAAGNVNGFTSVNRLMGKYKADLAKGEVTFKEIGTTKMAAATAEHGKIEQEFITLLEKTATFDFSGNTLTLRSANGDSVLVLVRSNLM